MDLVIDTSGITFQVGRGFEARLDKDGVHRRDKQGGTSLPLYAVQLIAFDEGGAETILVTVATDNPPKVSQGSVGAARAPSGDAVGAERYERGEGRLPRSRRRPGHVGQPAGSGSVRGLIPSWRLIEFTWSD